MGTVLQMYATGNPADAMASIDVPMNGRLIGVQMTLFAAMAGADFNMAVQLSFGSTGAFATNDARQVIANLQVAADLTTSGATSTHANEYISLPDIPVGMGERLYIHGSGTAIVLTARMALHFDFELDKVATRRR